MILGGKNKNQVLDTWLTYQTGLNFFGGAVGGFNSEKLEKMMYFYLTNG